jgi:hypothetical protein
LRYSIFANPAVSSYYEDDAKRVALRRVLAAGASYGYGVLNWLLGEPSPGSYSLSELTFIAGELGPRPMVLALPAVDSDGALKIPAAYAQDLSSTATANHYKDFLLAVATAMPNVIVIVLYVGIEVDTRFGVVPADIAKFATFISNVKSYAESLWPGVTVSASFKFKAIANGTTWSSFSAVTSQFSAPGITYYCVNDDLTVKDPSTNIGPDFETIVGRANPFALPEYGFPSSTGVGSSKAMQLLFYQGMAVALPAYGGAGALTHATALQLSDSADYVGKQIGVPGSLAREFTTTLGLRGDPVLTVSPGPNDFAPEDAAKPAWDVCKTMMGGGDLVLHGDRRAMRHR